MSNNMTRAKKTQHNHLDLTREKKRQERRVSRNHQDWSKLCPDVLQQILESLNFIDFNQTKTVCSDWYTVWGTCMKPPRYPWQIREKGSSIMLFDPKEDKSYDPKVLGLNFTDNSQCKASSGNWLLMVDSRIDFYLVNVLTRKRINLPSMDSSMRGGRIRFRYSTAEGWACFGELGGKDSACALNIFGGNHVASARSVLSVDEETGDYFIGLVFTGEYLFTYKKGDDSWRNLNSEETDLRIRDLTYRDNKLYLLTSECHIKILDIFGEDIDENPYQNHPFRHRLLTPSKETKMAIRNSGEVLIIISHKGINGNILYSVFEMNHESKKWVTLESVGDNEMLIFGHGFTIKAPLKEAGYGFKSDSVYFVENVFHVWPHRSTRCGLFDIATCRLVITHKELSVSSRSRWFVPGFP